LQCNSDIPIVMDPKPPNPQTQIISIKRKANSGYWALPPL
jgi:hypothetical protein